jgi:hypothetical protein
MIFYIGDEAKEYWVKIIVTLQSSLDYLDSAC